MPCSPFRRRLFAMLALAAVTRLDAQVAKPAPARTTAAITAADLRSRLFRIADDSMMGRETGSKGAFQAAEYVAAEFKRLGLQPAGEGGGWFQAVPFWNAVPGGTSLNVLRTGTLRLGTDYVVAARAAVPVTDPVPVVYGGSASNPTSWIDAASAAGKVVVLDLRADASGKRDLPNLNTLIPARAAVRASDDAGDPSVSMA